jgi:flavin reductase (DIM6/NTAB) family NADH-FMN oxidoreductase RutF
VVGCFDSRAFRDTLGCFATGVVVVTTRTADGRPEGLTVNSFASVSLDPPLVLFSVDRKGRCAECFAESAHFAVHVLGAAQRELSRTFSRSGGVDWSRIAWTPAADGSPLLDGEIATLQCSVHAVHEGGDHLIVVGRVLRLQHAPGDPLLYFRGKYRTMAPSEPAIDAR